LALSRFQGENRMGTSFERLEEAHIKFIRKQRIFFTGSAAGGSRVNISPRGTDALRILSETSVAYRDLTGSGNETAAHIAAGGNMTIMFCAFSGPPSILRLYGKGECLLAGTPAYESLLASAFDGEAPRGTRHIIRMSVEMVQRSCGFGVPLFAYKGERETLAEWTARKSDAEMADYRKRKNRQSVDGLPAEIPDRL
jgi:hypothetical protein